MSGQRMFVAIEPPENVREDLEQFLAPRTGMPWIASERWHITLAFLASVPEHRTDDVVDALQRIGLRHKAFDTELRGAGAFPDPLGALVLWLAPTGDLTHLATAARAAANSAGATPDGQRFVAHLTLARLRRPMDARKWLSVLDTYVSPPWRVDHLSLIASYLGEGRRGGPRYETVAEIPLGDNEIQHHEN